MGPGLAHPQARRKFFFQSGQATDERLQSSTTRRPSKVLHKSRSVRIIVQRIRPRKERIRIGRRGPLELLVQGSGEPRLCRQTTNISIMIDHLVVAQLVKVDRPFVQRPPQVAVLLLSDARPSPVKVQSSSSLLVLMVRVLDVEALASRDVGAPLEEGHLLVVHRWAPFAHLALSFARLATTMLALPGGVTRACAAPELSLRVRGVARGTHSTLRKPVLPAQLATAALVSVPIYLPQKTATYT